MDKKFRNLQNKIDELESKQNTMATEQTIIKSDVATLKIVKVV